ncbi:E3 ubiquitin-protein ligase TRIM47-like [Cheilinus undulatus]|uniref:E3 ubiquitin-protein ligase TRIM47-like n=1 Tax=Cheilinus undulatus TaxID=241271 RepID=UPI001BD640F6|nr:E3 ubiquitin-protein ligase TRIM47-like [Cheilinus undulatus]
MADSQELLDCSICLQLLEDPVTTNCGHSYCARCINAFWDGNSNGGYSCPQCRHTSKVRPDLKRNTLLAALLEKHRTNISQSAAVEAGNAYAERGDVACDVCTGRKRKASVFCLVCMASYCEIHLKPHYEVPPLKKHRLTQASARIQESICERHDKLLEIFCRSDQQFICLQCVIDGHKGHDMVTVDAEKCEMQKKLEQTKQEVADRVLISERRMVELRQAADSIRGAAWEACDEFEQICAENIRSYVSAVERKCSEMREKVREAEKAGVDWTNSYLGELQREVLQLRRREAKLNQLSQTANPIQFFQGFQALGDLPAFTDCHKDLDVLTEFVDVQKDQIKGIQNKGKSDLFSYSDKNEVPNIQRQQEDITLRKDLFTIYKKLKLDLDPNTVAACLCLSDTKDELSWGVHDQAHPDHPDRFTFNYQALCENALTGNHYWEVEWDGGIVDLAVSYKGIERKGSGKDSYFGHNKLSWKLTCSSLGCVFWHNGLHKGQIPPAPSRRVGVHLDYEAGTLAFYSVSDPYRLTLLHKIQTKFTEPLYPGFSVDLGSSLKICNI